MWKTREGKGDEVGSDENLGREVWVDGPNDNGWSRTLGLLG